MGGLGHYCGELIDCASYEIGPERAVTGSPGGGPGSPDGPGPDPGA